MFLLVVSDVLAQAFEGQISYSNSYQSDSRAMPNYKLTELFGSSHSYFVKNRDYKLVSNGTLLEWQIFSSENQKLTTKLRPIETSETSKIRDKDDVVKKVDVLRNAVKILDVNCDEFIVSCKRGTHKFYLDSKLNIQASMFIDGEFNRWFAFFSQKGIIPYKMVVDGEMGLFESTAIEITEKSIDENIFISENKQ